MKKIEDNDGNIITIDNNGSVLLKLKNENRSRKLGILKNDIYIKYDDEKHIFRKLNAWSIPYELFKLCTIIIVKTKKFNYKIELKGLDYTTLHFKNSGVERKIYIPITLFNKKQI
jgi:hypothetical protein